MEASFTIFTSLILSAAVNTILGLVVIFHNKESVVHQTLAFFIFCLALWAVGLSILLSEPTILWANITITAALWMFTFLFFFSQVFPNPPETFFRKYYLFVYLSLFMTGLIWLRTDLFFVSDIAFVDGRIDVERGVLYPFYFIILFLYAMLAFLYIGRNFIKSTDYRTTEQFRYLFIGVGLFLAGALSTNLILPFFGIYTFNTLGPLSSVLMVGSMSYAIARHQLMDIRIVIQRGLIYLALLAIIVWFYIGTLQIFSLFFQETTGTTALVSALITTVLGIFGVPIIERYFRQVTDSFFFKDKYNYSEALHRLSQDLHKSIELDEITSRISEGLSSILKARSVNTHLEQIVSKTPPATDGEVLNIPIVFEHKKTGTIVLGEKRSGDPYTREDITLLETFSYQIATTLERARLLKQVQEYSKGLEQKVEERTRELRQSQEEQRQMITDISHSLQTPLTIVKSELDFLKGHVDNKEKLEVFERSIDDVSTFMYDLLRLARLEQDSVETEKEHVNLSSLLRELVEYFAIPAREHGISVTSTIESDVFVSGNPKELEELFSLLLSNAMKYIGTKQPKDIHLTLEKTQNKTTITVTDTGIGIAEKDLLRIFDRFYRAKNKEHDIKGSGLGLSIARAITQKHSGNITASSTLGEGTTFSVILPVSEK